MLPIGIAGELVSIGTLLAFVLVCAGVLTLRCTHYSVDRPFRCSFLGVPPDELQAANRREVVGSTLLTIGLVLTAEGAIALFLAFGPNLPAEIQVMIFLLAGLAVACLIAWALHFLRSSSRRVFLDSGLAAFICMNGILVCLAQMASLPGDTWLRLVVWMAIGLVIYFGYGFWRSNLARAAASEEPDDGPHRPGKVIP